jgi:light-regulated signal transduction histidine kinase (bacteriophytochrome)
MNLHHRQAALTECDREPIHQIAAIQPFGALFAVDQAGIITQSSLNAAAGRRHAARGLVHQRRHHRAQRSAKPCACRGWGGADLRA